MNLRTVLLFIFAIGILERFIFTLFVRKEKQGLVRYKWTTYFLISTYICCIVIILVEFFTLNNELNFIVTSFGACIEVIGIYLRRASVKTINGFWSKHIKDIPGQLLIQSGPYALIRHPYYLSVMLELIGWALFLNSFLALIFIIFIHFSILLVRISLEEKQLSSLFGKKYKQYMIKTNCLLPKI